jgi:hypothetical protein
MKKISICSSHAQRMAEDSVMHEALRAGYSEDLPTAERDRILEEASWRLEDSLPLAVTTDASALPGTLLAVDEYAWIRKHATPRHLGG